MQREEIISRCWRELSPHLDALGFELVEVEYRRNGKQELLRIFLDQPEGITLDDCAAASRMISHVLDEADFISEAYMLEVSSPGIDRPVRKPEDFQRFINEPIKIQTLTPIEGRKRFGGVLRSYQDGLVAVDCGEQTYEIHIENIAKAKLDR